MVYEFASQTLTVVCLFLPLSAIWAGTAVGDRKIATRGVGTHRKLLGGFFDSAGTAGSKSNFSSTDSHSQSGTCVRSPASTKKSADKSRHGVSVETAFDVARGDDMV
jgi:pheromone alpha factor receptor